MFDNLFLFHGLELIFPHPRQHLHCAGGKNYPTIAQKHFNAADPNSGRYSALQKYAMHFGVSCNSVTFKCPDEESVILARWLMGITVAIAAQNGGDEHSQFLDNYF